MKHFYSISFKTPNLGIVSAEAVWDNDDCAWDVSVIRLGTHQRRYHGLFISAYAAVSQELFAESVEDIIYHAGTLGWELVEEKTSC